VAYGYGDTTISESDADKTDIWDLYFSILTDSLDVEAVVQHSSFWLVDLGKEYVALSPSGGGRVLHWRESSCKRAKRRFRGGALYPTAGIRSMAAFTARASQFDCTEGAGLQPRCAKRASSQVPRHCVGACFYTRLAGLVGRNGKFPLSSIDVVHDLCMAILCCDTWSPASGLSFRSVEKQLKIAAEAVRQLNTVVSSALCDSAHVSARGEVTWVLHRAGDSENILSPGWCRTVQVAMTELVADAGVVSCSTSWFRKYLIYYAELVHRVLVCCCGAASKVALSSSFNDRLALAAVAAWCEQTLVGTFANGRRVGVPSLCADVVTKHGWEHPGAALLHILSEIRPSHMRFFTYTACVTKSDKASVIRRLRLRELLLVHEQARATIMGDTLEHRMRLMILMYDSNMRLYMQDQKWGDSGHYEFPALTITNSVQLARCGVRVETSHKLSAFQVCDFLFAPSGSAIHPKWSFRTVVEECTNHLGLLKKEFCEQAREFGHTWSRDDVLGTSALSIPGDQEERKRVPSGLLVGFHAPSFTTPGHRVVVSHRVNVLAGILWDYVEPFELSSSIDWFDGSAWRMFQRATIWDTSFASLVEPTRIGAQSRQAFDKFISVVLLGLTVRVELIQKFALSRNDAAIDRVLTNGVASVRQDDAGFVPEATIVAELRGRRFTVQEARLILCFWQSDLLGLFRDGQIRDRLRRLCGENSSSGRVCWLDAYLRVRDLGLFCVDRDWIFNASQRTRYRSGKLDAPLWFDSFPGSNHMARTPRVGWPFPIVAVSPEDTAAGAVSPFSNEVLAACAKYPGNKACDPEPRGDFEQEELGGNRHVPSEDQQWFKPTKTRRKLPLMRRALPNSSEDLSTEQVLAMYLPNVDCVAVSWANVRGAFFADLSASTEFDAVSRKVLDMWTDTISAGLFHFEEPAGETRRVCVEIVDCHSPVRGPRSCESAAARPTALEAVRHVFSRVAQVAPQVRYADHAFVFDGIVRRQAGTDEAVLDVLGVLDGSSTDALGKVVCFVMRLDADQAENVCARVTVRQPGTDCMRRLSSVLDAGSLVVTHSNSPVVELACSQDFRVTLVRPIRMAAALAELPAATLGLFDLSSRESVGAVSSSRQPVPGVITMFEECMRYGGEAVSAEPVRSKLQPKALFCSFTTMVVLSSLGRLLFLDQLAEIGDIDGFRLVLAKGEAAVAENRSDLRSSFALLEERTQAARRDAGRVLLFWQNGLYGLFSRANVLERLRHVYSHDRAWFDAHRDFCEVFDFDKLWFGNSAALADFRSKGIVPAEAVSHLEVMRELFPRCRSRPAHARVEWQINSAAGSVFSGAMQQLCQEFPGPAFASQAESSNSSSIREISNPASDSAIIPISTNVSVVLRAGDDDRTAASESELLLLSESASEPHKSFLCLAFVLQLICSAKLPAVAGRKRLRVDSTGADLVPRAKKRRTLAVPIQRFYGPAEGANLAARSEQKPAVGEELLSVYGPVVANMLANGSPGYVFGEPLGRYFGGLRSPIQPHHSNQRSGLGYDWSKVNARATPVVPQQLPYDPNWDPKHPNNAGFGGKWIGDKLVYPGQAGYVAEDSCVVISSSSEPDVDDRDADSDAPVEIEKNRCPTSFESNEPENRSTTGFHDKSNEPENRSTTSSASNEPSNEVRAPQQDFCVTQTIIANSDPIGTSDPVDEPHDTVG
jgi:hypothetical protein